MVKKYKCTEISYQEALFVNQNLNWNDWFVAQLKNFFGTKQKKNKQSAISLSNGHHIITIFGYDDTKAKKYDEIKLFIHDSTLENPRTKKKLSNEIKSVSLGKLKNYFVNPYGFDSIAISYLENNNQSV